MRIFLTIFPAVILATGALIYRQMGKKELMKIDLVQFTYAFIISPMIIVWIKTVVFLNLTEASGISDPETKFIIDTVITILSLFVYAFLVIHSLTKTFALKKDKDPLFDIFEHAEYFHLWLSHLIVYSGVLFFAFALGVANSFFPLPLLNRGIGLVVGIFLGVLLGFIFYYAMVTYKVEKPEKFDKIMNLQIYIYTFLLTSSYIVFGPKYAPEYSVYWASAAFYLSSVGFSQILKRARRRQKLFKIR